MKLQITIIGIKFEIRFNGKNISTKLETVYKALKPKKKRLYEKND